MSIIIYVMRYIDNKTYLKKIYISVIRDARKMIICLFPTFLGHTSSKKSKSNFASGGRLTTKLTISISVIRPAK